MNNFHTQPDPPAPLHDAPRARIVADAMLALRALLPALLPVLLFLPVVLAPPINHDVAAVVAFAERWFAGEELYADLIDVNPPLIFVLNLIPATLAAYTPLNGVTALRLCVLAVGAYCWFLGVRARDRAGEGKVERALLDALPVFFVLGAGYDFGQREHLMTVAALPYVMCAGQRAAGRQPRGRIAIAVVAAIGFALKPHFLAIPALVELAVLLARLPSAQSCVRIGQRATIALRQSLRDPVPWVLAVLWVAYLASIPLLFPDYLNVVLPLVWSFYVGLGGLSAWQVLLVPRLATAVLLLLPALWFAFVCSAVRSGAQAGAAPRLLGLAALGAVASAMGQHKGWSYHIVPTEMFACALAALLAARWLDGVSAAVQNTGVRIAGVLIGLCTLYVVANGEAPWNEIGYPGSDVQGLTELMAENAAGERVLVLSPGIAPIYPAVNYAGVVVSLRTMNMWLLQAANETCLADGKRYRDVWEMGRAEFFVYRTVAEDFARAPPAAVVVDRQSGIPFCGEDFDFIAYFSRHPLFAEVWSHYQQSVEWKRYRIYVRKD